MNGRAYQLGAVSPSFHAAEWIIRFRPEHLVPIALSEQNGHATVHTLPGDLVSLEVWAMRRFPECSDVPDLMASLLRSIRTLLAAHAEGLYAPFPIRMDPAAIWMTQESCRRDSPLQPVLTCIPVPLSQPDVQLLDVARFLLCCGERQVLPREQRESLSALRILLTDRPEELSDWLDSCAAGQEPSDPERDIQKPKTRWFSAAALPAALSGALLSTLGLLLLRLRVIPLAPDLQFPATLILLVSMAGADSWLLFRPASPLYLGPLTRATSASHVMRAAGSIRYRIRQMGILPFLLHHLLGRGEPDTQTHPLALPGDADRLGYLSEGEPGTPSENEGLRAYLLTDEFIVGRDPDRADLVVPEQGIGRVHARITRKGGTFFVTDLGSVNGTYLDHKRLNRHEETRMPDRCRIRFSGISFHFTAD